MTVEDQLRNLIRERYGTQKAFCKKIDMANTTLCSIFSRGVNSANLTNILDICKELNISADALAKGRIVPLSETREHDIAAAFADLKLKAYGFALDGIDLTDAEVSVLFDTIDNTLNTIRRLR